MADGNFDYRAFFTGIDPSGGGKDEFGQNIPGMIPGGGALGGLAQVAGGIADIAGSRKEIDRQRRLKRDAAERARQARAGLEAFEFDVSQAQRDLATAGIRPTDLTPMQSLQATELAALSTDPRALMGGIGASTARAQAATQAAQQADLQREIGAMRGLADLEQSALEKKQALQLGLQQQDYMMGLQDRAQAQANIEAARQAKRQAFGSIAGGLANIGIAAATGGLGSKIGAAGSSGPARFQTESVDSLIKQGLASGVTPDAFLSVQRPISETDVQFNPIPGIMFRENGGRVKYEGGGVIDEILRRQPVQKTEGEFNHDTNKKAIIDEETGVKEGEATGGEYILNPEQGEEINMAYKGIEQIVDSGEEPTMDQLMALYEAVRNVFSQPQFNEA
ncbi:MAG: hypothetical protein ACYSSM_00085 [Planctomycetota bacterium]|jgi:hypothetical protein